jgi:hypothetical protein
LKIQYEKQKRGYFGVPRWKSQTPETVIKIRIARIQRSFYNFVIQAQVEKVFFQTVLNVTMV